MSANLTHFLLPSSRLPTDVTFLVEGARVAAHRSILATALPYFDHMFFGQQARAVQEVQVADVTHKTFLIFLHHVYGHRLEVEGITDTTVLSSLSTLGRRFGDHGLVGEVVGRMRALATAVEEAPVAREQLPALLQLAGGEGALAEAWRRRLATHLATTCPSTTQLATLLADLPESAHPALLTVLRTIPTKEVQVEVGREEGGAKYHKKEVLLDFLQFTRFPEDIGRKIVEVFMEKHPDL